MNLIRAIWDELKLALRLTFLDPIRAGRMHDPGWLRDKHLRLGGLIGMALFVPVALAGLRRGWSFPLLIGGALVSNLLGFAISALSRRREAPIGKSGPD